ncbi:type III-A CRISPR-associated protein Cas10/Csm1 [Fervidobacterium islandicum]|uniref:type III-A CRISPR-associated protein Cas10/Csm1 n=1 Tax=Fervidobacterium islandicum TaxID=2423 RepID=UPI003A78942E
MGKTEDTLKKWKDILYLASLFHDIGKFRQRGEMDSEFKEAVRKEYNYEMKSHNSGLAHQYIGALICKNSSLPYNDEVAVVVSKHHEKLEELASEYEVLAKILSIADKLSASERMDYSQNVEVDKIKYMKSIISKVTLSGVDDKVNFYRPLSRFSLAEEVKSENELSGKVVEKEYENLWREFEPLLKDNDLKQLWIENPDGVLERIHYLLKEYTSTVPSAFYYSEPDISLFSHSSSTAAIAISLLAQLGEDIFQKQNDRFLQASSKLGKIEEIVRKLHDNASSVNEDEELFGVIKGDISGIQDFIYKTSVENGLKKLRARSFFIAYLAEVIARYIVRKEGLYNSNILYCGGGHFYLLVPAKTIDKLEEYQTILDKKMYDAFGLDLSVLLAGMKISLSRLVNFNVHDDLSRLIEEKKNRKFASIINVEMFIPEDFSGPRCPYCGRKMNEIRSRQDVYYECTFCESFVDLGYDLANSKFLLLEPIEELNRKPKTVHDVFRSFGFELSFQNEPDKLSYAVEKTKNNTYDPNKAMYFIKMASYVPTKYIEESGRKVTADLETIAKQSEGVKRWAILRGDVDNLGSIFRALKTGKNSENRKAPISYVATLSSELEMFFSIALERFVRSQYNNCSVIYSGGDDFMILGPWNELPMLAHGIRKSFETFTKNKNLSISMAIAIAPSRKYPVYKLGTTAGVMLDEHAKAYKRNGKEKDAIYFLRGCIGWEEFERVHEIKEKLKALIQKGVSRNLLHVLETFANEGGYQLKIWKLYYYVGRLMERQKKDVRNLINEVFSSILVSNNKLHPKLGLIVKWVEDETRNVQFSNETLRESEVLK